MPPKALFYYYAVSYVLIGLAVAIASNWETSVSAIAHLSPL